MKIKERILKKVYEKLGKDCKDVNMGLSDRYFEELVMFIIKEGEKEKD